MEVIGITGGVGSGKSYVARRLGELLQAELLITDELGHVVMEPGRQAYDRIVALFGDQILEEGQRIDRKALADIVFADTERRAQLNGIIHPAVLRYIEEYLAERRDRQGIVLLETALMYETGCDRFCDRIWVVEVDDEQRIERLQRDRGYSRQKAEAIIASQMSADAYRQKADLCIANQGSKEQLEQTLREIAASI